MEATILISSDNFKKITYILKEKDKNKLVIVGTKEDIDIPTIMLCSKFLIDYQLVKENFCIYDIYINSGLLDIYKKINPEKGEKLEK